MFYVCALTKITLAVPRGSEAAGWCRGVGERPAWAPRGGDPQAAGTDPPGALGLWAHRSPTGFFGCWWAARAPYEGVLARRVGAGAGGRARGSGVVGGGVGREPPRRSPQPPAGWKCPSEQVIRPNKQTERGQGSCLSTQAEFCDLFCDLAPDKVLWSMRTVVADFSVSPRAGFKLVAEA